MVSYLQVQNLTRRVGDRTLFQNLSFGIAERQKVGLIAQNGTGKSTLLNILTRKDTADEGEVVYHNGIRIGYLEQSPQYPMDMTVLEACFWHGNETTNLIKPEDSYQFKKLVYKLEIDNIISLNRACELLGVSADDYYSENNNY